MSTSPIMRYFDHRHLKEGPLRDISKEYTEFAHKLDSYLPDGAEKSTALRKLLESKDSAVRSALDLTGPGERAKVIPDDPSGIDEGTEELPVVGGEEGGSGGAQKSPTALGSTREDRQREREEEQRSINSSLPKGVTMNITRPPTSSSGMIAMEDHPSRGYLSDIERAQLQRLQARRTHGY